MNLTRLLGNIHELAAIGLTEQGGCRRIALTDDDRRGRDWAVGRMLALGMQVQVDQLGNIFGTRAGREDIAPVMCGSHIDTVGNGGKYDGCYGVLAGLELVESLNEQGTMTRRPLVVAIFTNEEGVRFMPDMMGSLVHAGGYPLQQALDCIGTDGVRLGDALAAIGYAGSLPCGTIVPHAFLELHIEQGPRLEAEGIRIGAVEDLQGISWTEVSIDGQSNHAGTTPMALRHDAGYCAARLAVSMRSMARLMGGYQVATIGVLQLKPGLINVVPGSALLTIDLRNTDEAKLRMAEERLASLLPQLAKEEGVCITTRRLARFEPVRFDQGIVALIEAEAAALGLSCRRMCSGAGHDAQMLARICPTAMVFVPSARGLSHHPDEYTAPEDLDAGAQVFARVMLKLAV